MTLIDAVILILFTGMILYGVMQGFRPALFLLVTVLTAVAGTMLLSWPLERLFLRWMSIENDAPAVAVLLIEGMEGAAFAAALIPSMITAVCFLTLLIGGVMLRSVMGDTAKSPVSRILGMVCGAASGTALTLILAAQLHRLPWPPAGNMFHGSLLIGMIYHAVPSLIPALAGGI